MYQSAVKTLLFTDIEGSTRLWEQVPDKMRSALASHDVLMREAVEANAGRVVKMLGDGMYAVFDDPPDGLRATVAIQRALADSATTLGIPLRIRCALHAGAVEYRDGDYFGNAVNRAARIMGAAHGGQVLVSETVADLIIDQLPAGIALQDLGSVRLRDLAQPAHIYQVMHPDLRADFPALRSLEATPNNLPRQATSFIGRERELREARELLGRTRLLTIVGPGGIGKTRLTLQLAADALDAYPDGVWFIELASILDPALVPKTVAQVLNLQEDTDTPLVRTLCAHVASRRLLLVLDNCEHLVEAAASLVNSLLRAAPDIRVLASSREALNVPGEQTFSLPPLGLPKPQASAEDAARSDAGQLFVERARLRQPDFALTEQNAQCVAQICARLDGIPLALELAAARVGVLSVQAIASRLNDRFRLLTGGSRTALPRQQTLRALIDWSYDLLDDGEKVLFARLSVFAGGFTIPAAEHVSADHVLVPEGILDLLIGLAHKSLIVPDTGEARYRMLETIRDYARQRLRDRGDEPDLRARHRDYFVNFAERAESYLEGDQEQPAWLAHLDLEHDNLRAALDCSLESTDGDDESGLRLCGALYRFWAHRGHALEGRQWCAASLARSTGRPGTAASLKAMHASGTLAWRLGDITVARSLLEEALALSRKLGDRNREGRVLNNLGGVAIHQVDAAAARKFLEQAAAIHQATGDRHMECRVLNNLAALAINCGEFTAAEAPLERAVALSRGTRNRMEEAMSQSHLGFLAQQRGRLAHAQELHERALATAREFGVREFEVEEVRHLGEIALARGELQVAGIQFRTALEISKEIGNQHEIALTLEAIAPLLVELKMVAEAARLCGATDALRQAIATPRAFAEARTHEATVEKCRASLNEADASALAATHATPMDVVVANALAFLDAAVASRAT